MPHKITLKETIVVNDANGSGRKEANVINADSVLADLATPSGLLEYRINGKVGYIPFSNLLGTIWYDENEGKGEHF